MSVTVHGLKSIEPYSTYLTGGLALSLALIDGTCLSQIDDAMEVDTPDPGWWQGCNSLALIGFTNTSLLKSWYKYLSALNPGELSNQVLRLWLIGSPDPLWIEQKAQHLFGQLPQAMLINSWPIWDEQHHGKVNKILYAIDEFPFWREQEKSR